MGRSIAIWNMPTFGPCARRNFRAAKKLCWKDRLLRLCQEAKKKTVHAVQSHDGHDPNSLPRVDVESKSCGCSLTMKTKFSRAIRLSLLHEANLSTKRSTGKNGHWWNYSGRACLERRRSDKKKRPWLSITWLSGLGGTERERANQRRDAMLLDLHPTVAEVRLLLKKF